MVWFRHGQAFWEQIVSGVAVGDRDRVPFGPEVLNGSGQNNLRTHDVGDSILSYQQHHPRALDRGRELTLVFCAIARNSARQNLAAFGHELLQQVRLFEVDIDLVNAQLAVALDDDIALVPSALRTAFTAVAAVKISLHHLVGLPILNECL